MNRPVPPPPEEPARTPEAALVSRLRERAGQADTVVIGPAPEGLTPSRYVEAVGLVLAGRDLEAKWRCDLTDAHLDAIVRGEIRLSGEPDEVLF